KLNPQFDMNSLNKQQEGAMIPLSEVIQAMNQAPALGKPLAQEKDFLVKMRQREEEIKARMKQPIEFSQPILWWQESPMIFPYTINLIQGQTGSHKSRLAELFCSAMLAEQGQEDEILGLRCNASFELLLLYVDTERNLKEQYPYALQSILRRAGYTIDKDLPHFRFVSLLEFDRRDRFEALQAQLNYIRQESQHHIIVILDVLTDCVSDFNRTDDSMKLIDLMNQFINQYDVTFLCVIHENPGQGSKARGHLGTEAANKASTVLQIGFEKDGSNNDTDIIRVKSLKRRNAPKSAPLYLRYDQEVKGLVMADADRVHRIIDERRPKAQIKDVIEQLEILLFRGVTKQKDLLKALGKHFQTSEKTLKKRLNEIEERALALSNGKGEAARLISEKQGRDVEFRLEPLDPL
ncbi:MAG: hypothetical protein AAFV78_15020, partial [Bacteroidota bacterium]